MQGKSVLDRPAATFPAGERKEEIRLLPVLAKSRSLSATSVTNAAAAEVAHCFPIPPPRSACATSCCERGDARGKARSDDCRGAVDCGRAREVRAAKDASGSKEGRTTAVAPCLFFKLASYPFRRATSKTASPPALDRHRPAPAVEAQELAEHPPCSSAAAGLSESHDQTGPCLQNRSVSVRRAGSPDTVASEDTLVSQRQEYSRVDSANFSKPRSEPASLGSILVSEEVFADLVLRFPAELIAALDVGVKQTECIISGLLWPNGQTPIRCKKAVDPVTGRLVIHSATLPALIHFLACEGEPDHEFADDFLATYQYFSTALDVARLLVVRYLNASISIAECVHHTPSTPAEPSPSPQENEIRIHANSCVAKGGSEREACQNGSCKRTGSEETNSAAADSRDGWDRAIQFRVIGFIKRWIDARPGDLSRYAGDRGDGSHVEVQTRRGSSSALDLLWLFLETVVVPDKILCPFGKNILQKLAGAETAKRDLQLSVDSSLVSLLKSIPRIPKSDSGCALQIDQFLDSVKPTPTPLTPTRPTHRPFLPSFSGTRSRPSFIKHCRAKSLPSMTSKVSDEKERMVPLSGLDPTHLAHELAVLEHEAFRQINISEFMNQAWLSSRSVKEARAPNLKRFILWFDRVAYGCATEVLRYRDVTSRAMAVSAFIIAASYCLNKLRAYNTCFEIMAGLGLGPVRRLHDTWDAVSRKLRREFEDISRLVSSAENHRFYRRRLKEDIEKRGSADGPWVPYLGVNLKDQVFAEVGNPTYLAQGIDHKDMDGGSLFMINLSKFRLISRLLRSVMKAQQGTYGEGSRPDVWRWISDVLARPATEAELYQRSRELEGPGGRTRDVWPPPAPPSLPTAEADLPSTPATIVLLSNGAPPPQLTLNGIPSFDGELLLDDEVGEAEMCCGPVSPASFSFFSCPVVACSDQAWSDQYGQANADGVSGDLSPTGHR